jgi:hypothetical protein
MLEGLGSSLPMLVVESMEVGSIAIGGMIQSPGYNASLALEGRNGVLAKASTFFSANVSGMHAFDFQRIVWNDILFLIFCLSLSFMN